MAIPPSFLTPVGALLSGCRLLLGEDEGMSEANNQRRLRKQPTKRRVQVAMPVRAAKLKVPPTAQQRRRRNNSVLPAFWAGLKWFTLSSRWVSLGILGLILFAFQLVATDESFYLGNVPVEGAEVIPYPEILSASGLVGAHIFAVDPQKAAAQVAELPGVISATVSLQWPNQAQISIAEDSPIAIWIQEGQEYWVNGDGSLMPARGSAGNLLRIEAEPGTPLVKMNDPLAVTAEPEAESETEEAATSTTTESGLAFVPAAVLEGALQLKELRPNIERLFYKPSGGLSYQDGRGWRAYFGEGGDMVQKLVVYETLVNDLLQQQLTPVYISVSNQEKPFYLANGQPEEDDF